MKTFSVYAALVLALIGGNAFAQTRATTATSGSDSQAQSAASNNGVSLQNTFESSQPDSHTSSTLRNTPGVVLGGFSGSFSSDYCGGTAQAGGGFPGVSLAFGGPVIDTHCVTLRTFERTMQAASTIGPINPIMAAKLQQAAVDMLCTVSDEAAAALKAQGVCTDLKAVAAAQQQQRAQANAGPQQANQRYAGTDPIVMHRLGITQ